MCANMCFIALEDNKDKVISSSNYDELKKMLFDKLYLDLEKLRLQKVSLKSKFSFIQNELNGFKENFDNSGNIKISFKKENTEWKNKNEWLTSSLEKISNSQKIFNMI